jgi:hypothetical protein
VILLDKGVFFKRYRVKSVQAAAEHRPAYHDEGRPRPMAWRDGKRVGFRHKGIHRRARWIRLASSGHSLYPEPST